MLSIACAVLFAAAAAYACATIASTLRTHAQDIVTLRALRHRPERMLYVMWRVRGTGRPVECEDFGHDQWSLIGASATISRSQASASRSAWASSWQSAPTSLAA